MLDQGDELHLAPLIHAIAGAILGRAQKTKLTFPVSEHVRLEAGQLAHVANRKEFLDRL
jgi:hypothetical protein